MGRFWIGGVVVLVLGGCWVRAGFGEGKKGGIEVEITAPKEETMMWINECKMYAGRAVDGNEVAGRKVWYDYTDTGESGKWAYEHRVWWTSTKGSFTEIYSPEAGFIAPDYLASAKGGVQDIEIEARVGGVAIPQEALAVYEGVVERFDHKRFYQVEWPNTGDPTELVVVRAAILAASIYTGEKGDGEKARKYLDVAMADLVWTSERRRGDWLVLPRPVYREDRFNSALEKVKFDGRVAGWEKRRGEARANKVLSPGEMDLVRAAVRQYGLSFGKQSAGEVRGHMGELMARYPGSAIAEVAEEHIERVGRMEGEGRLVEGALDADAVVEAGVVGVVGVLLGMGVMGKAKL